MYLSGDLTPLAVAQAILPLIRRDTTPPGSHSIGFFDSNVNLVLAAAKASTLRYKEKRPLGPLDGVPLGVKDEYDIEGYTTCLGSRNDYTGKAAPGDSITAWCVRKLEEAGAVNVGKLSMHEFGLGMFFWLHFSHHFWGSGYLTCPRILILLQTHLGTILSRVHHQTLTMTSTTLAAPPVVVLMRLLLDSFQLLLEVTEVDQSESQHPSAQSSVSSHLTVVFCSNLV